MNLILDISLWVNAILVVAFTIGSYFLLNKDCEPKKRANITTSMVFMLFVYSILIALLSLHGLIHKNIFELLTLFFVIVPFVIGKLVEYDTVKKYTILQILFFIISFIYLYLIKVLSL